MDRQQTLLHYIVHVVEMVYPNVLSFYDDLSVDEACQGGSHTGRMKIMWCHVTYFPQCPWHCWMRTCRCSRRAWRMSQRRDRKSQTTSLFSYPIPCPYLLGTLPNMMHHCLFNLHVASSMYVLRAILTFNACIPWQKRTASSTMPLGKWTTSWRHLLRWRMLTERSASCSMRVPNKMTLQTFLAYLLTSSKIGR